jgi:hypothetical protein
MKVSVLDSVNVKDEVQYVLAKGLFEPTDLCRLMSLFGSDKGSGWHNYTVVYDALFSRFRNQEDLAIFELGIGTNKFGVPSSMGESGVPGASLRGWRSYFPRARIYGADIERDVIFEEDRISTYWTDQKDPHAINALWDKIGDVSFDIMVDDGLHEARANICFFMGAFWRLKAGGIYAIEDILPDDALLLKAFANCIAYNARSVVLLELPNPHNAIDNRVMIVQKG